MCEIYSTSDLWLASLLSAEAKAQVMDVQVTRSGRKTVFFTFSGENLSRLAQSYCQEQALANVCQLRRKMNDLRDLIFQARKN